jgi:hypothetical protein
LVDQSLIHGDMQVSLGIVFARLRARRTHQVIGDIKTNESRALAGLPARLVGLMDQRIGSVSTTNESASAVGVFEQGIDMKDFSKR